MKNNPSSNRNIQTRSLVRILGYIHKEITNLTMHRQNPRSLVSHKECSAACEWVMMDWLATFSDLHSADLDLVLNEVFFGLF